MRLILKTVKSIALNNSRYSGEVLKLVNLGGPPEVVLQGKFRDQDTDPICYE